ncbi:MAG: zinc ribbon domain-containing protein [Ktedonobacteraceae bacterium]
MAKATTTIKQVLNYRPEQSAWFAANQSLFNQVAAFYFDVIQAHVKILDLSNKEALTALEKLTHTTQSNLTPAMPLEEIAEDIPALFRRAAINAALGSARSFFSHLATWQKAKAKAEAKGKTFPERPPVPPRTWNKSASLYAGMWKERSEYSIVLKVWTGTCWSWVKVRITGRQLPPQTDLGSPQLIRRRNQWYLHTPIEKQFKSPGKIAKQITTHEQTKICSVDLNLEENLAVCTIRTVEGSILATTFIHGGQRVNGFRKKLLGRIARNRRKTVIIAENEQDNVHLWNKIRQVDEQVAHLVSNRIVQFAQRYEATILVFEHLGNLKPTKGKYSKRGNDKRAYWMKGRIFRYAKYKASNAGMLTSRVNPRNTSRECARCHSMVVRYAEGQPAEGYTSGAPLVLCHQCRMKGSADRNASLVIGQRLMTRYQKQEKPPSPLLAKREPKGSGEASPQDAKSRNRPSIQSARHGVSFEHGTAQDVLSEMARHMSDIAHQLRLPLE